MNYQTPLDIQAQEGNVDRELNRLPTGLLMTIKQEMGLHDKDLHSLTLDEKVRMVAMADQRHANQAVRAPWRQQSRQQRVVNGTYPREEIPGNTVSRAMGRTRTADTIGDRPDVHTITEGLATVNLSGGGGTRSTARATSSSITAPSPSAVVNGTPTNNPATQPTTLPEVPPSFLSTDFMRSVANTLDDFDPQALFRPEDGEINFERDFREWFNPDDLETRSPTVVNGRPTNNPATQPTTLPEVPPAFPTTDFMQSAANTLDDFDPQTLFRPENGGINFEQDFREWFNPDDLETR
ncbi:hypothetical protein BU15DRAFT_79811 [Melanogaster broomeanus]|nr:hypothetical protein BU15DRAFT_79811 [Melanogaster broomeanus]